jgi:hypothetical protein
MPKPEQKKAPGGQANGADKGGTNNAENLANSAKNASAEVSFNSKVPDAEKEVIGYLLNFPDDIDSFNKLKREHFGHPNVELPSMSFKSSGRKGSQSNLMKWLLLSLRENGR